MARTIGAAMLAVVLLGGGCKQKPKEEEPIAAAPAPVAPAETAAPAASAPAEPDTIPPPVQPTAIAAPAQPAKSGATAKAEPAKGESIGPCCTALHKEATESPKDKGLYQTAAASCDAIAKLVSSGTTKKAAALTQLRANLRGAKLPAGCE